MLIVPGKPPRSPSVLGSIDFAIFLVGAEGDSSGLRLSATSFHGAAEGGDVEIGAIGGPEPDQAARLPGPGSVLVAAGGSLYTSMEMFGTVEVCVL